MKRVLVVALWALLMTWVVLGQAMTPKNLTLCGTVVTGVDPKEGNQVGLGEPLGGVEIEVQGTEFKTTSNANGFFVFEDLPDGVYTLLCRKSGYPVVTQRVRVAYAGMAARCQILMNPAGASFVGGTAVTSGTVYVAYSERSKTENNMELTPHKNIHQMVLAAGGDVHQLWGNMMNYDLPKMPKGPEGLHLMNPVTNYSNCLMVYPPDKPDRSTFVPMQLKPYWLCFNQPGTILYCAGSVPMVQVFDAARNNALLRNIPTPGGVTDLKLSPDGRYLLVSCLGQKPGVMLIDTVSNVPAGFLPTDAPPFSAVMAGPRVFVCTGDSRSGEVIALDAATGTKVGRCKVGTKPTSLAVTPDFTRVFAACSGNSCVSVVDTLSVTEVGRIPVGVEPLRLAISPDGTRCFVSNKQSDTVSVIDVTQGGVINTTTVGKRPIGVVFSGDGRKAYVACKDSAVVMTLDGRSGNIQHTTLPMPNSVPYGLAVKP